MRNLLRDQDDTAVVKEAAMALLRRHDSYGAELIFETIATADEETVDHLLYFIGLEVQKRREEFTRFRSLAEASLAAEDDHIRQGAAELIEDLGWKRPPPVHGDLG